MAKERWKLVQDNGLDAKYYDSKRYNVSYDPAGNAHFSKRKSGRDRARSAMKDIGFYRNGLLVLIFLITLIRFIFMKEFGYDDAFFKSYGDNVTDLYGNRVDLFYFDVFGWFKYFANGVGRYKYSYTAIFDDLNGAFKGNVLSNMLNTVAFIINFFFAIIKTLLLVPLSLLGLVLGGPFAEWSAEGGWVYETLGWSIPYTVFGNDPAPSPDEGPWSWAWWYFWNRWY